MNLQQRIEKLRVITLCRKVDLRKDITAEYELMRLEGIKQDEEKRRCQDIKRVIQDIPPIFQGKTFGDFKVDYRGQEKIKTVASRYVKTFKARLEVGTNLLFLGKPGTGKTLLSLVIYQALALEGYGVSYKPSLHFLRTFREKNFESQAAFEKLLAAYKQIKFLIIDEATEGQVSGGSLSGWEKEMLFTLIDTRYQTGKLCTLIISNRSGSELMERLGERIIGRLTQNSITLAFNWNSYR